MHQTTNCRQILLNACRILFLCAISAYEVPLSVGDIYLPEASVVSSVDKYEDEPSDQFNSRASHPLYYISSNWKDPQSDLDPMAPNSINLVQDWTEPSMEKRMKWYEMAHRYKKIPEDEMWAAPIIPGEPSDLRKPRTFNRKAYSLFNGWHSGDQSTNRSPISSREKRHSGINFKHSARPGEKPSRKHVELESYPTSGRSHLYKGNQMDRTTVDNEEYRAMAQQRLRQLAALLHDWRA